MMQHLLASEQIQVYCNANSCFKGQYPLHSAADTTNVQTARILIVNGASVYVLDEQERTPFIRASGGNGLSRVAFLRRDDEF